MNARDLNHYSQKYKLVADLLDQFKLSSQEPNTELIRKELRKHSGIRGTKTIMNRFNL